MIRPGRILLFLASACSTPPAPAPVAAPPRPTPPPTTTLPAPRVVLEARFTDVSRLERVLEQNRLPVPELLPADLAWARTAAPPDAEIGVWALARQGSSELSLAYAVRLSSADAGSGAARAQMYTWSDSDRVLWSADRRRRCNFAKQAQSDWLVCGDEPQALSAVSETLANRAQSAASGVSLSVKPSLMASVLGAGMAGQLGPIMASLLGIESRNVKFDQASGELIRALVAEGVDLFADVDRAELRIEPSQDDVELRVDARLHFTGRASWWSGLLEQPTPPAPELFWDLPAGADDAWFFRGLRARRYEPVRAALTRLLYEQLDYQGTPLLLRERATALLRQLPLPSVPIVYATGPVEAAAKKPEGAEFQRSTGWHLVGIAEPPDRVVGFLDACATAYADDVLGSQLRRVLRGFGERHVPLAVKRKPGAGGQLPRGAMVWELSMPGRRIDPRQGRFVVDRATPEPMLLFVVGRDDQTWLAWSGNPAVSREQLGALLRPSPKSPTLREASRLQLLRAGGALLGGLHRSELVTVVLADHAGQELKWSSTLPSRMLGELVLSRASP